MRDLSILFSALLPEKFPDTMDWFLESAGGVLSYSVLRMIQTHLARPVLSLGM